MHVRNRQNLLSQTFWQVVFTVPLGGWLMSRRGHSQLPVEERMRVVLAVLSGELTIAEAARRHGTTGKTVGEWRDRFLESGQAGLENMMPWPGR
jgi:transposase